MVQLFGISFGDLSFWLAVAAALVAIIAAIAHLRAVAAVAALFGLAAAGLTAYANLHRGAVNSQVTQGAESQTLRTATQSGPIQWSRLSINTIPAAAPGKPPNIATLGIIGINNGKEAIKIDDAYFLSGVDGTRLDATIDFGGSRKKPSDMTPIPPGGLFFVLSNALGRPNLGLAETEFLKTWASLTFVIGFDGTSKRIRFDQDMISEILPKP
jgi:hypothetical protein